MDYIKLRSYPSRIEAEIDKGILESYGIQCIVSADDVGGARPDIMMATGGALLLVEEKEIPRAKEILAEKYKGNK